MRIKGDSVSDYDRGKIDSFRSSIAIKEGFYFVDLSRNKDKLAEVPSNHQVAVNVLDRVVIKLEKQNLYDDECKVFLDQESKALSLVRDHPTLLRAWSSHICFFLLLYRPDTSVHALNFQVRCVHYIHSIFFKILHFIFTLWSAGTTMSDWSISSLLSYG